jgi:hypothetical protein
MLRSGTTGAVPFLRGTLLVAVFAGALSAQFTVTPINISPNASIPGRTIDIAASGFTGTIAAASVTVTLTGPGGPLNVTANNIQAGPGTERIISFIAPNPGVPLPETYQVGISGSNTGGQTFTSTQTLAFTINPTGTLTSVTPAAGQRGQTINNVALAGSFTNWVAGQTTVSFGPDITVSNINVTDATHASVTIAIGAGAALGLRPVSVTSQGQTATKTNGFTVLQAGDFTVTLLNVSPGAARSGLTVDIAASGFTGTIPAGNVTVTLTGPGGPLNVTASNVQAGPLTERLISFVVPNPGVPLPETYQVTLSGSNSGGQTFASANSLPFTINPAGTLVSVTPAAAQRGQTINNVQLVGSFTNWVAGQTTVNFGADITVSNVSVTDATHASVTLAIGAGAALGVRPVSVTSQSQTATKNDGFTVQQAGDFSVTLINISPAAARPGSTVDVTATGFSGTINAGNVIVTLTGPGGPLNVTASNLQAGPGTERIISFVVPNPGVPLPASYQVTVSGSNTGGQTFVSTNSLPFTINPTGTLVSVLPASGLRGQTISTVQLVGSFTNWIAGQTTVSFGPDITVSNISVTDSTHASVTIAVGASAALGIRAVSVTSQSQTATKSDGFTVQAGTPSITLDPVSAAQGITLGVNITGVNTTFSQGVTAVTFGGGIIVNGALVTSPQALTVNITIPPGESLGAKTVTVTTGSEVVASTFSVTQAPAKSITVAPAQGQQGQTVAVTVTGTNTNFVQGLSTVSFEPGITLGPVTVSGNVLSFNVTIPNNTPLGARDVTVTTNAETVTAPGAFTVIAGPASIVLNPAGGAQGTTLNVTITGTNTNFTSGSIVQFSGGITAGPVTLNTSQSLTVSVTIPPGETLGVHTVTVTTGTAVVNSTFNVTQAPAKSITLNPNQGQQGQTLTVNVTGLNTNFVQGTTAATFGAGISVNSVTVNSATSLSVSLAIANNALLGSRDVTITTGVEIIPAAGAFAVTPGPKTISVAPPAGIQGQTLNLVITGINTNFTVGSQVAFSPAADITVNSVIFSSTTVLTANVTIGATAATGVRDVTMTTGSEIVTASGAFTVGSSGPQLVSLSPNVYRQGQTLSATITARNTVFTAGSVQVNLGAGVTVQSVSINSPTVLTVQLAIASDAALGTRTLTVITAGQTLTLPDAATITSADTTVKLISVVPNSGVRGQSLAVTITGENTHFVQGTTQVNLGAGITVNGVSVTSATVLTAQLSIANDAELGFRTAAVTTGSEVAALASALQVVSGGASGQPFTCNANAGVPPLVRAEGLTELVGDILIVCTGGVQGQQQTANIQLFLNAYITSRLIGSTETEALLIVDELGALPGSTGATPAVYRGQRAALENAIVWPGVVITAPGNGQRILRITNVRANASQIGVAATLIPNQITAFLSASPSQSLPINNPQQTVAFVQTGLVFDVRNCASTTTLTNTTLAQCIGVNNSGNRNLLTGTTGDMQFAVRFQEGFQTAFKPQILANQIPSVPGTVYSSESGFVRNTAELPYAIGGADHGTRLVARFQNVPAGVRLFVTTGPSHGSASGVSAVLVQTGPNGEGGGLPQSQTPFAVASTVTLNCAAATGGGQPGAEIPVVNGTATAVWEITAANPALLESAAFGVAAAYTPDLQNRAPAVGQITVGGDSGPFYAAESAGRASATLPVPRFSDQPAVANALSIESCITNLLFPFVTNQQGFDTGIAIANTSRDVFGNPNRRQQSGVCTVNYFGQTAGGGAAPAAQRTNTPVASGNTLTFILSSGGNYGFAGTPGFQGYIFAQCEFQYAHGFAFITDGPVGAARVAEGYLALVVTGGFNRAPATGETLGH